MRTMCLNERTKKKKKKKKKKQKKKTKTKTKNKREGGAMSTGKFQGLSTIKNVALRKKHQVLAHFGKANETVDLQYDQEWKRFDGFVEVVKLTQKHLADFLKVRSLQR
jgi:hypothetical protein